MLPSGTRSLQKYQVFGVNATKNAVRAFRMDDVLQLGYIVVGRSSDHERDRIAFDKAPKYTIVVISFMSSKNAR